jgi:hypothetical protein
MKYLDVVTEEESVTQHHDLERLTLTKLEIEVLVLSPTPYSWLLLTCPFHSYIEQAESKNKHNQNTLEREPVF